MDKLLFPRMCPKKPGFRCVFRILCAAVLVLACFPLLLFMRTSDPFVGFFVQVPNDVVGQRINVTRRVANKSHTSPLKPNTNPLAAANETVFEVTVPVSGQLGNRMFQYAALLGIAHMNNRKPLYPVSSQLSDTFLVQHLSDRAQYNDFMTIFERAFATYTPGFESLPRGKNVRCMQYLQSWKYFDSIRDEIRREFTFKESLKTSAARLLAKHSKEIGNKTKVGIHVRRGDMMTAYHIQKGYHTAPASYIIKAMDYMRQKHGDVIFIVVTQDPAWTTQNTPSKDYVIVDQASATEHLALLASCDHIIMTVGTYGWWAGYLSGGDVVYYWDRKLCVSDPPKLVEIKDPEDFFPRDWIGMAG